MKRALDRILTLDGDELHDAIRLLLCKYTSAQINNKLRLRWQNATLSQDFKGSKKIDIVVELVREYGKQLDYKPKG